MGLLILLGLGLVILLSAIVASTAWMLTHPPRRTYATALARSRPGEPTELDEPRPFETWTFRSRNLELPVWDIPGDVRAGPTIILIHGWADSRIGALARVPFLTPVASRIIALDLPGHGEAPSYCRLGTSEVEDVLALMEHLGSEVRPVLFGWSLGAGVALAAAARSSPAAVIAESVYRFAHTPARNVLRARGLPSQATLPVALGLINLIVGGGLARSRFDRTAHAAKMSCPVLILHGDCDEVCPVENGRQIAAAIGDRATLAEVPSGRHNDLWTDPDLAAQAGAHIQQFLAARVALPASAR